MHNCRIGDATIAFVSALRRLFLLPVPIFVFILSNFIKMIVLYQNALFAAASNRLRVVDGVGYHGLFLKHQLLVIRSRLADIVFQFHFNNIIPFPSLFRSCRCAKAAE